MIILAIRQNGLGQAVIPSAVMKPYFSEVFHFDKSRPGGELLDRFKSFDYFPALAGRWQKLCFKFQ
ncbi:hypothetical protein LSO9J_290003 [Candidatus Liberibacter solanacearum]